MWVRYSKGFMSIQSGHDRFKEKIFMVEMFCVKCKKKVVVDDKNVKREMTSKGRPMLRAICPNCGTKMTKFTK